MKARDVMITQVYKVKETDTVRRVLEKFVDHGISGVPVVNEANEIVGYVSDGDIMRFIGRPELGMFDSLPYAFMVRLDENEEPFEERSKRLLGMNVMEIAKKKVVTVDWNEDIQDVAALLGKKRIKKLPVVRGGVLVGIISRGNVIRHAFTNLL
ncbi:CBS domain-containing protein [Cohnella fermenti]|uniref:CBS domain-containing protein n=1 Tax=Cohnella fermenti TaxID=2565925 RepID=A0A4S4C9X7_9BACL|nr:CBS domain-containing protein [Cohnella fermenti]THF84211.1 CBS domain-containing protein [Cohnella fermenti]